MWRVHAFEEEGDSTRFRMDVVLATTFLEIQAQVEERLAQYTRVAEQECDQQRPTRPLPSEEGMDGLELNVRQSCSG